eukprot:5131976-Amphidinium_carterae.1
MGTKKSASKFMMGSGTSKWCKSDLVHRLLSDGKAAAISKKTAEDWSDMYPNCVHEASSATWASISCLPGIHANC